MVLGGCSSRRQFDKPMNDGNFENVRFMVILNTAQKTASLDNTL